MKTRWIVDVDHSQLYFKVKYLMISEISGVLPRFSLHVETIGDDFGQVSFLELIADVNAIDTQNQIRDKHLKSADFFDVERHPSIQFIGTEFEKMGMEPRNFLSVYRKDFRLHGNLTIKGNVRPIILYGHFGGTVIDSSGRKRAGFSIRGEINRKLFGFDWNQATPGGKLFLGDEVQIRGNIQLIKQH